VAGDDSAPKVVLWVRACRHQPKGEVVKRVRGAQDLVVPHWRWVVARTFGWLRIQWRLGRDGAQITRHAEAWIDRAMIRRFA